LLASRPSLLQRLIYTASLRDCGTGTYEDKRLLPAFGAEETDRALRREHLALFEEWLTLDLTQQTSEMTRCFSGQPAGSGENPESWISSRSYDLLIPNATLLFQRKVLVADLAAILPIVRATL
jgi:hypothetical protein